MESLHYIMLGNVFKGTDFPQPQGFVLSSPLRNLMCDSVLKLNLLTTRVQYDLALLVCTGGETVEILKRKINEWNRKIATRPQSKNQI